MAQKEFFEMRVFCGRHWHWLLTILVIVLGVLVYFKDNSSLKAADIGSFLSGFASALAFLWLVKGLHIQSGELALQRQELSLQRETLVVQSKEMRISSKFQTLNQIESILSTALQKIKDSGLNIEGHSQLITCFTREMHCWKTILESTNPQLVNDNYISWAKYEGVFRGYLNTIAWAIKFYMEHYLQTPYFSPPDDTDEDFVCANSKILFKAPFLSEHAGSAPLLADMMSRFQPGLEALKVAGMFSMAKLFGNNIFNEGALEKMKNELIAKSYSLPEIAK